MLPTHVEPGRIVNVYFLLQYIRIGNGNTRIHNKVGCFAKKKKDINYIARIYVHLSLWCVEKHSFFSLSNVTTYQPHWTVSYRKHLFFSLSCSTRHTPMKPFSSCLPSQSWWRTIVGVSLPKSLRRRSSCLPGLFSLTQPGTASSNPAHIQLLPSKFAQSGEDRAELEGKSLTWSLTLTCKM